jgi:malonyl-CoA decarboxylase
MAPGGTGTIVSMRQHLLEYLPQHPELAAVDADFQHLLSSWFNRGFLTLRRIDWKTPADILEKLMNYEAVHAMNGWDDLRRRLAEDRRCYAFFHPALPDDPLIFVQVALVVGLAASIQSLLEPCHLSEPDEAADTAVFYSISDCQKGLKGITFGNFLIKQVVMELRRELPNVSQFATLSPIPGFKRWLDELCASKRLNAEDIRVLWLLQDNNWLNEPEQVESLKPVVTGLCARYLYMEKRHGKPIDPVARFHLRNGAMIGRLNWFGDTSDKGLKESAGMLVNYCYDLERVEKNHEAYVNDGEIAARDEFRILDTRIMAEIP